MIDLEGVPYFRRLKPDERRHVEEQSVFRTLSDGQTVFSEGDMSPGLGVVVSGEVRVIKISSAGREQVLTTVSPPNAFNEVAAFDNGPCPATVVASGPSEVVMVSRRVIRELVMSNPEFAAEILATFARRLRMLTSLVADLTHLSVRERLGKVMEICKQSSADSSLHLRQADLAALVGSTREVVARELKTLEDEGLIVRQHGTIKVL